MEEVSPGTRDEYERSSVSWSLLSCASIRVIYAFSILLSALARKPLSPGSFLACWVIYVIESISIKDKFVFLDIADILLSRDIME